MNNPIDPAYTAALRCKPFIRPEIYAFPTKTRREGILTLPADPVLIEAVEPGLELGDALCIAAAVGLWVFAIAAGM